MSRRIYSYSQPIDLGELGTHCGTFTAAIDSEQNRFGWSYYIEIVNVLIDLRLGGHTLTIPATEAFIEKEHVRKKWEDEILRDYQIAMNKDEYATV